MSTPRPHPFRPRALLRGLSLGATVAAATLASLAPAPARADLFEDEFVTPFAPNNLFCKTIVVERATDTVLDLPEILPITAEVWGINMERLQTLTVIGGPGGITATKGTLRTAAQNRDGVAGGRGCHLKDSAEVTFRAPAVSTATQVSVRFTKGLEVGDNFDLPVKFHPLLPTLLTQGVSQLTSCLGAGAVQQSGDTITISAPGALLSALTCPTKFQLQPDLPSMPQLDIPNAANLLDALVQFELVPNLGALGNLVDVGPAATAGVFDVVLDLPAIVQSLTGISGKGGAAPLTERIIPIDLKLNGVKKRTYTVKVKLLPDLPIALPDLEPVFSGTLFKVTGIVGEFLGDPLNLGQLAGADPLCVGVPVTTAIQELLGNLSLQQVLTILTGEATQKTLAPLNFGARNNSDVPVSTPFAVGFTGGRALNQTQNIASLPANGSNTSGVGRPQQALKVINIGGTVLPALIGASGCLVVPPFTQDPSSVTVNADKNGAVQESNEGNNSKAFP